MKAQNITVKGKEVRLVEVDNKLYALADLDDLKGFMEWQVKGVEIKTADTDIFGDCGREFKGFGDNVQRLVITCKDNQEAKPLHISYFSTDGFLGMYEEPETTAFPAEFDRIISLLDLETFRDVSK